ncbi:fumarylacetoacetate hydrolase family protein [Glutamicibacter creatinolyticus]|uniref:fumarylacetoacetate hydrolase family protein n=1 Tax=Glutamicibacter creatinolyticus TaxID=162496 RepID=UPI003B985C20
MKLATLRTPDLAATTAAALISDHGAQLLPGFPDVQHFLRAEEERRQQALEQARASQPQPHSGLVYATLIPNPSKVLCIGLNYRNHIAEVQMEEPKYPTIFAKFASSLTGANDSVEIPGEDHRVDYEGELAVIIGAPGRRIPAEHAHRHIAGYAISNDISMRGYQGRTRQWLQGKAWDASTPVGPWLVTADEFSPGARITTKVNGQLVQDDSTDDLVFNVAELVSYISAMTELQSGDLILTGTPAGVAVSRKDENGRRPWLKPGDVLETSIEGLGTSRLTFHPQED